jgi:hypothetical protein
MPGHHIGNSGTWMLQASFMIFSAETSLPQARSTASSTITPLQEHS